MKKQPAKKTRLDFSSRQQFPASEVRCYFQSCESNSEDPEQQFSKIRSERGKPRFLCKLHTEQDRCSILDEIDII
jgi:hypothetical protein